MATAIAHPNIALVKYWGKQLGPGNLPATPSLSITVAGLATTTRVEAAERDSVCINGEVRRDTKVEGLLGAMREDFDLPPLGIHTRNDFPTGAGLASSASGFAALVTAIDAEFELRLSPQERSAWARRGSASAARSIFGGFATLAPRDGHWSGDRLLAKDSWPLELVIAVTDETAKPVPSSEGMERSRATSPFYEAWCRSTEADFETACQAVTKRDFGLLSAVAEHSCMKLHALMLSSRPALLYWNQATIAAIATIRRLQDAGTSVFYTIDAGPQVKAVCAPGQGGGVAALLARSPGVLRVVRGALGDGARLANSPQPS
ncbi:MAG: diphosphomevalonate decarboxylase [Gammaproteobacteria bacterium]|nr:diphosphomevalonate decarboxylase [Gammaproteobacteria bacterium]MYF29622.1 diphosphomevalonate decarboxylase [Gammaproteobacteria bacterium]MYK44622.1 diphosphomevalonate decarboxylase [Gammaproteobacteria bacterium]